MAANAPTETSKILAADGQTMNTRALGLRWHGAVDNQPQKGPTVGVRRGYHCGQSGREIPSGVAPGVSFGGCEEARRSR